MADTGGPLDLPALLAQRSFVRALARSLLSDRHGAEDVEQETWLALLRRPPADVRGLRGWLATVARNLSRTLVRRETRRQKRERAAAGPGVVAGADAIVEREAVRRRVVDVVFGMPEPYRSTLLLRFYEGLPPREIARRHGVPVETVKTRIKRGLERARRTLDETCIARDWRWALLPLAAPEGTAAAAAALVKGLLMKTGAKVGVAAVVLVGAAVLWRSHVGTVPTWVAPASATAPTAGGAGAPGARPPLEVKAAGAPSTAPVPSTIEGPKATGRVIDPRGRPVAGALVASLPDDLAEVARVPGPGEPAGPVRVGQTDAEGRFSVRLAGRAPFFILRAEAPGFAPAAREGVRPEAEVTITLCPPRSLTGTVRDLEGRPVPGARVRCFGLFARSRIERETVAGSDGGYRLEELPPDDGGPNTHWIEVRAEGFAPLVVEARRARRAADGVFQLDVCLLRGATLTGRVLEGGSERPIAGARVILWAAKSVSSSLSPLDRPLSLDWLERVLGETRSGPDGAFRLEGLPAWGPHVGHSWQGAGHEPLAAFLGAVAPGQAIEVRPVPMPRDGATLVRDLHCHRSGTVEGRVVDARGRPVPGASVWLRRSEGDSLPLAVPGAFGAPEAGRATSDADGRYVLGDVPAYERPMFLRALAPDAPVDGAGTGEVVVRAGATVRAPDLVLAPRRAAWVEVVDGGGRPVWGATVTPGRFGRERRTDERGRVQLLCFPPAWASPLDEQRAIVRVPGYGVAASPPFVPSPDEPPLVRVTVEREHRVSGRVLLADEQPAQDAFVRVRCEGLPQAASGRVAEDGSFEVSGLPDGPYTIFADRSPDPGSWGALPAVPSRTSRDGVAADATDVVLRFPPAPAEAPVVPVEGTVRDAATGRPVLLFQATLGDGRRSAPASVAGPGAFRFLGMPSGTWMLRVRAPGYLEYRQPGLVLAPPAAPAPLSLRLERGVALRGTVRRAGGGALGDAPMTLTDWKRSRSVSTWIGSDGSWSESGFEAGESLEVLVRDPDGEGHWMPASGAELVVPGGAPEATVDLTAVRAGIVSFVLSGPRPASAASRVTLRDRSGRLVREWTGLKAETRWAALLPGPYTLRAEVPGAAPEERSVTLVPGRTTELTFPIP